LNASGLRLQVVDCSIEDPKVVAPIAGADDGGDAQIIEVGVAEACGSDSAHVSPNVNREPSSSLILMSRSGLSTYHRMERL
jgi:hypothetical protein